MDFAREIELIHTIDREVQQLLTHADELASAGVARPVLTDAGRRLQDHLAHAAALIGPLVALVPQGDTGEPRTAPNRAIRGPRRSRVEIGSAPVTTSAHEGQPNESEVAAPGVAGDGGPLLHSTTVMSERRPGAATRRIAPPEPAGATPGAAVLPAARTPVYRLRKAGARDSDQERAMPSSVEARDELRRLGDFLMASSDRSRGADPAS